MSKDGSARKLSAPRHAHSKWWFEMLVFVYKDLRSKALQSKRRAKERIQLYKDTTNMTMTSPWEVVEAKRCEAGPKQSIVLRACMWSWRPMVFRIRIPKSTSKQSAARQAQSKQ